jgi:hypothetical protein
VQISPDYAANDGRLIYAETDGTNETAAEPTDRRTSNKGEPPRQLRESSECPLNAGCHFARAVRRIEQAAGEHRGEGEPVLDWRSAPSHPQPLSVPNQLAQLTERKVIGPLEIGAMLTRES